MKILYLGLSPGLRGPLPKTGRVLIRGLEEMNCQVLRRSWGRHSEGEGLPEKIFGRLGDLIGALRVLADRSIDIVFVATTLDMYSLWRDVPLLLSIAWHPAKKVVMMHGSNVDILEEPGHRIFKALTRWVAHLSDAILLLSSEEESRWQRFIPGGRYYQVANPFIASEDHTGAPIAAEPGRNESPTILFVGRLTTSKGILDILDAMPLVVSQVDCRLQVAGAGEQEEAIRLHIQQMQLTGSVELLGYLEDGDLADAYRRASILVLPTYFWEGFPLVLVEAMSYGLPIVTTPRRGIVDHLEDGVNALLVPPKDSRILAEKIIHLLKHPQLRARMGAANLLKVQEFRPENVVPRYIDIFSELLGVVAPNASSVGARGGAETLR